MKGIGILPEQHLSYVDHLIPLCQIMGWPVLVTDPQMKELISYYYPPMEIFIAQPEDFNLDPFLEGYDIFLYVDFFRRATGSFQFKDFFASKKARSVMSLHGNPDKYRDIYWIEQVCDEDILLVYGSYLIDFLRSRGVGKEAIICGNYRLEYYLQHASFFDHKIPFSKEKKTILYAPTWKSLGRGTAHHIQYSNFFEVYRTVFDSLSRNYQLIVKLHPHLVKMMPDAVNEVIEEYPFVYFLHDFPLIYPLLKQIDVYLGDYSSIGYDFLYFDRPLFFLETGVATPLQACGKIIKKEELPLLIDACFERKKMYQYVYGERKPTHLLKQEIENACRSNFIRS
jgi:hypothetical protein